MSSVSFVSGKRGTRREICKGFVSSVGSPRHPHSKIDFSAIATAAAGNAESLIRQWLPDGRRYGREWIVQNPTRCDRKAGSFAVNLMTGKWADFATGDKGGDLISLRAYLDGSTQLEAARMVAVETGVSLEKSNSKLYRNHPQNRLNQPPPPDSTFDGTPPLRTDKTDKTPAGIDGTPPGRTDKTDKTPTGAPSTPECLRHPKHGEPARAWLYLDAESRPIGYACRFETPDGGKVVLPFSWTGTAWQWRAMPEPRPLFDLPSIRLFPELPIIVAEGEKAADAARTLFDREAVATTWAGGCKAWAKTDWHPLAGRKIILWPDADEPGRDAMNAISRHLLETVGAASVRLPNLPADLTPGYDAADCPDRETALRLLAS
jgi:putative DNA primase/helicase